jgi:hypothetical protein
MKRIVVLIDGTWNKEGTGADTNVAKLDSGKKVITQAFIKANATGDIAQHIHYHDGVGSDGDLTQRLLGGAIGLGLKKISDVALIWMIARVQALTNLEFDIAAVRSHTKADIAEAVVDSTESWVIDHAFPHSKLMAVAAKPKCPSRTNASE